MPWPVGLQAARANSIAEPHRVTSEFKALPFFQKCGEEAQLSEAMLLNQLHHIDALICQVLPCVTSAQLSLPGVAGGDSEHLHGTTVADAYDNGPALVRLPPGLQPQTPGLVLQSGLEWKSSDVIVEAARLLQQEAVGLTGRGVDKMTAASHDKDYSSASSIQSATDEISLPVPPFVRGSKPTAFDDADNSKGEESAIDLVFEDGSAIPPVPSVGSIGHPFTCGQACKYHSKPRGCKDGRFCVRCHLCKWRAPPQTSKPSNARKGHKFRLK
jgi:hypothetical protein